MSGFVRLVGSAALTLFFATVFVVSWVPSAAWSQNPPHVWSQNFWGDGDDAIRDIVLDDSGNTYAIGTFGGSLCVGGDTLTGATGQATFLAKFDPDGDHVWSLTLGGPGATSGRGITTDDLGNVYVTGQFSGSATIGNDVLTSAGSLDIFLARFDTDGSPIWSRRYGSTEADYGSAVTTDAAGNVVVTGTFNLTVDFGNTLTSVGGGDVFIAKYTPSADHLWSTRLGTSDYDYSNAIERDGGGNLLLTGNSRSGDIYIAKYAGNGTSLWNRTFSGTGNNSGKSLAIDDSGHVFLTGQFWNTMNFGGENLTSAGNEDVFVAKYDGDGNHFWSKRYGGAGDWEKGLSIAVDSAGDFVIAGSFGFNGSSADFGGGVFVSVGESDMFMAGYRTTGEHRWSMTFGGGGWEFPYGLEFDANDNMIVGGAFEATVDFGGGPLTTTGGGGYCCDDIFMAKYTQPEVYAADVFTCPQGDTNPLSVHLDYFDDSIIDGDIPAESIILGDPLGGFLAFVGTPPFTADGDATADNGYQTSITVGLTGQCSGGDEEAIPISVHGRLAGTAFVRVASPDMNGDHMVDAFDLGLFSATYDLCEGDPGYNPCANLYDDYLPGCVTIEDFGRFGLHWLHQTPNSPPSSKSAHLAVTGIEADVSPVSPTENDRRRFLVSLSDVRAVTAVELQVAFDPDLEFHEWVTNPNLPGTVFVNQDDNVYGLLLVTAGERTLDGHAIELGEFVFLASDAYRRSASGKGRLVSGHAVLASGEVGSIVEGHEGSSGDPQPPRTVVYRLEQNMPNPFNPSTRIRFSVPTEVHTRLAIYDLRGNLVNTLIDAVVPQGFHAVTWNGADNRGRPVASGVYSYKLTAGEFTDTRRLILLK